MSLYFKTIKLDAKSSLLFYPNFYKENTAKLLYKKIEASTLWQQGEIKIFGKKFNEPRLTYFEADEGLKYKYSSRLNIGCGWTKSLQKIRKDIQQLSGFYFNSVLLNYYRDQNDSMGWHRDNEKELGANPVVASLSLGQSRVFWLRRYKDKSKPVSIMLPSGSLLIMSGRTQHDWEHCVKKQSELLGGRINLTFRKIIS